MPGFWGLYCASQSRRPLGNFLYALSGVARIFRLQGMRGARTLSGGATRMRGTKCSNDVSRFAVKT